MSDLDIDSKRSLLALTELHPDFDVVGQWAGQGPTIQSSINSVFDTVAARPSDWVKGFEVRTARAEAFTAIYTVDNELFDLATENNFDFDSLEKAALLILDSKNINKWENQAEVGKLEKSWRATKSFFNESDYTNAIEKTAESKESVKKIVEAGLVQLMPRGIDYDLLFTGITLIIVLIVILYVIRNREKFKRFLSKEKAEEVEAYELR